MGENTAQGDDNPDRLLGAVRAVAVSPLDAKALVQRLFAQSRNDRPGDDERVHQERVVDHLISRYAKLAATSGGVTALAGVVPGVGTAVAMVGGAMTDTVVCMKLQVDMCMCMAETFGYDLHEPDAQHLSFLIAAGGALEKAGVETGVKVASKAGVKVLQQYLKGAALITLKAFFRKLGLVFTRKALERALPFGVGVLLGAGGGYALTMYVGSQAKQWFLLDRDDRAEEAVDQPRGPEPQVVAAVVVPVEVPEASG
jgi:hypothetical protein